MFITYVIVVGIIVPPLLQNSVQYEKELLHQTMLSVDSYLEQINSICVQCSYSQSVYDIILKNYNYEYEHVQEYISDRWEIFKGLQNYAQFSSGVHSIYLYNANGLMYYYSLCPTINSTFNGKDSIWYDDLSCTSESKRNTWITGIHEPLQEFGTTSKPVISLIRNILDLTYFTVIGQAEIQIDSDTFHQILQSSNVESLSADREMILVDQSGYVINSLSSDYQPGSFLDNELYEIARSAPNGYSGEINGKLIHTVQSDFSGWYLIGLTDKWSIFEIRSNILSSLFLIVLISIILLVIFGFVLTQKISRPINLLHQKVNALKKGNYDYHVPIQGSRELVNLSNSFDEMAQHLKDDRNKIYQMEGQKRNAEILALQTQINPHFIFNTLNTVKYLAVLQKYDQYCYGIG